jgi:hypothetical protein
MGSKKSISSFAFVPLASWIVLQMLVLLISVLQIPLSDKFPNPVEKLALDEMIVAQISFSALLFPILFTSSGSSVMIIGASWPFLLLAGVLSATPRSRLIAVGLYMLLWFLVLAIAGYFLISRRARLIGSTVAILGTLGFAVLWYLQAEFLMDGTNSAHNLIRIGGPIRDALSLLHYEPIPRQPWINVGAILIFCSACALVSLLYRRRYVLADSSVPVIG